MKLMTLERWAKTSDGVFGRLGPWHTVEEEWQDNQPNVSCIPPGTYTCRRTHYHGGGYETFEICDVPGRSRILIHVANTEEDLAGCVGLGLRLGVMQRKDEDSGQLVHKLAVLSSRPAFEAFMQSLAGVQEFQLEITER